MMILITGGSGSGKSSYGEKLLQEALGLENRYYLATMEVFEEEGEKRVERHRTMRQGKGFVTIEQPRNISHAIELMTGEKKGALLECMSNLVANEMFGGENFSPEHIIGEIRVLARQMDCLIVVTNNVFEDGISYDDSTMEYLQALGSINQELAGMADVVTEVVAGIPVRIK